MKKIFLLLLLFPFTKGFATNYFVKNAGGTGAGTSQGTAWNLTKFKASANSISAGDTVFFNRGETYNTNLPITTNSGTSSLRIVYTSYGTGANPVFDGFTTLTSWTPHPTISGVFYASLDVPALQTVLFDGVLRGMGRYPETGYITLTDHSGISSVTAPEVSGIPFNPAGGELVAKKARYIIDRHPIISRGGTGNNTIYFSANDEFGDNNTYTVVNGDGFFIQNHVGTLNQLGEWYYDKIAKRFYVYFGAGGTAGHTVQAAAFDNLVLATSRSYLSLVNLNFSGANLSAINVQYSDHLEILGCSIINATVGIDGLQGSGYAEVNNNYIASMLSGGITTYETPVWKMRNNYVRDIHLIPGMGYSGDLVGSGITFTGNGCLATGNRVSNVGYCGIAFYGSAGNDIGKAGHYDTVINNIVDTFCNNKDDGGGIYVYGNQAQTFGGRVIANNIVLHGVGSIAGVSPTLAGAPFAIGIYLDNLSSNINVHHNLVAHNTGTGFFFNSVNNDTLQNNISFNNGFFQFLMLDLAVGQVNNLKISNNQFIAATPDQILMDFETYVGSSDLNNMGSLTDNYFYRPFGNTSFLRVDNRVSGSPVITDYTPSSFLSTFGKLQNSTISTVPISSSSQFVTSYNFSPSAVTSYVATVKRDVLGNTYNSAITLAPYSGYVFIDTGTPVSPSTTPNSLKIYRKVKLF